MQRNNMYLKVVTHYKLQAVTYNALVKKEVKRHGAIELWVCKVPNDLPFRLEKQ